MPWMQIGKQNFLTFNFMYIYESIGLVTAKQDLP